MNREVNISAGIFDGNGIFVAYTFTDPSTPTVVGDFNFLYVTLAGTSFFGQRTQILNSVASYATTKGYTVTNTIWYMPPEATTSNFGFMSAADKTKLDGITAPSALSFSAASRSLNSAFQVSTTRTASVSYSVDIATSVSLAGGAVGTVYLEYADDSGFTTNVVEVNRFVNGNTGTLVIGLTLNQTNTAPMGGIIPAGKYVRLRTQNNTGTPTFTYRSGQEVLLASN